MKISFTNDQQRHIILHMGKDTYSYYLQVVVLEIVMVKLKKSLEKVIDFISQNVTYKVLSRLEANNLVLNQILCSS